MLLFKYFKIKVNNIFFYAAFEFFFNIKLLDFIIILIYIKNILKENAIFKFILTNKDNIFRKAITIVFF